MLLSQYLKLKITADKKIADAFSKGLQGVGNAARENISIYILAQSGCHGAAHASQINTVTFAVS